MSTLKMRTERRSLDAGLNAFMLNVYRYMGLGLALTGAVAWGLTMLPVQMQMAVFGMSTIAMFGTLGIALYVGMAGHRLRVPTLQALYWTYAGLMGLSLTVLFKIYSGQTIAQAFFVTALTFGATSIYGHMTERDLTSMGSFMMMGVWGLIIAGVANMFIRSAGFSFALSAIGVVVFVGLIAYETQNLRQMYYAIPDEGLRQKMSIFGALSLYVSVINLFLSLLRLFGAGSDRR